MRTLKVSLTASVIGTEDRGMKKIRPRVFRLRLDPVSHEDRLKTTRSLFGQHGFDGFLRNSGLTLTQNQGLTVSGLAPLGLFR